jgi:hypothetical protein
VLRFCIWSNRRETENLEKFAHLKKYSCSHVTDSPSIDHSQKTTQPSLWIFVRALEGAFSRRHAACDTPVRVSGLKKVVLKR